MLRQAFADRLKQAMKAREMQKVSAIRRTLAGRKDRDVAARGRGNVEGVSDAEIADAPGDDQAARRIDRAL